MTKRVLVALFNMVEQQVILKICVIYVSVAESVLYVQVVSPAP